MENTPDVARAVAAILERHQFVVSRAEDPLHAAERVTSEHFDVMIVEIRAASNDGGLRFLRRVSEASPHLTPRIVVISNDAPADVRRELEAIGVCDVIFKPVHETEILNAIQECLDRTHAIVQ